MEDSSTLIRRAFTGQKTLKLSWYSNLTMAQVNAGTLIGQRTETPSATKAALRSAFAAQWEDDRHQNRKLRFYNTVKDSFTCEEYLSADLSCKQSKRLDQMRTSAHRFNIETGRHGSSKQSTIINRLCPHCCCIETLGYLAELPFFEPILEDEIHVLQVCPLYEDLRGSMTQSVRDCLNNNLQQLFRDRSLILPLAKLILKIHQRRFPTKTINKEIDFTKGVRNNLNV